MEEGGAIAVAMAGLIDCDPGDAEVEALAARHHAWIEAFYPAPAALYIGPVQTYTNHPEFRAFYDRVVLGGGEEVAAAMRAYAERAL